MLPFNPARAAFGSGNCYFVVNFPCESAMSHWQMNCRLEQWIVAAFAREADNTP
jgi:hypothetical protein